MANFNIEIGLKTITCYKGHIYAIPYWMLEQDCECPMCAKGKLQALRIENSHFQHVISGLKGENTKLRGRLK